MNNNINYGNKINSGILKENEYSKDIYMSRTTDLIKRLEKTDPEGAKELKEIHNYEKSRRKFGLVYEQHAPEVFDVADAPIRKNDKVRIRPDRGVLALADNQRWLVNKIYDQDGAKVADLIGNPDGNNDGELELKHGVLVDKLIKTVSQDEVIYPVLSFDGEVIGDEENDTFQVLVNSENYDALRLVNATDLIGKVDCIYMDPPYNTGNKDWIYNNDYVDGSDEFRSSAFMNFLERRLLKAKSLLNPKNSVLIVTIDEKEYLNVGKLLHQIFPEARVQMVSSVINPKGTANKNQFLRDSEYIYIVMIGDSEVKRLNFTKFNRNSKKTSKLVWNSLRRSGGANDFRKARPNLFYPIYINDNCEIIKIGDPLDKNQSIEDIEELPGATFILPINSRKEEVTWQQSHTSAKKLLDKGYLRVSKNKEGFSISYIKKGEQQKVESGLFPIIDRLEVNNTIITEENEIETSSIPTTTWKFPAHDASSSGSVLIAKFLGEKRFDYPKSLYAVEDVIRFFVKDNPNALVMDFFGGSGTTVHAVSRLNEQDGGSRKSINITNNEISEKDQKKFTKQGIQSGDHDWEKYGVYEFATKPRITAAITGKTAVSNYTEDVQGYYKYNDFQDEYAIGDPIPKDKAKQYKDGMKQNVRFFKLKYVSYNDIFLGLVDNDLYNMIWLEQGQKGEIPQDIDDFYIGHSYAILKKMSKVNEMLDKINDNIRTIYVHGDEKTAQQIHKSVSPEIDVIPLWDLYIDRMKTQVIK